MMKGFTDKRSGLARRLGGEAIPTRIIDGYGPRLDGLALRALPTSAIEKATAAAIVHLTTLDEPFADNHLYTELGKSTLDLETCVQLLYRALVDPSDPTVPYAASVDEVRLFEPDEITVLFNEFLSFQEERSPLTRAKSWEEVEITLEAMGKGSLPPTKLNSYDASSLRFMLRELAVRHWRPTKPRSSDTSHGSGSGETSSPRSDATSTETTSG